MGRKTSTHRASTAAERPRPMWPLSTAISDDPCRQQPSREAPSRHVLAFYRRVTGANLRSPTIDSVTIASSARACVALTPHKRTEWQTSWTTSHSHRRGPPPNRRSSSTARKSSAHGRSHWSIRPRRTASSLRTGSTIGGSSFRRTSTSRRKSGRSRGGRRIRRTIYWAIRRRSTTAQTTLPRRPSARRASRRRR